MAQDQSVVPEGRCGFEMLAGDVIPHLPESLSEAVEQNRSAVCWRETTDGRRWCDWHVADVDGGDELVGNSSVIVLDGAKVNELSSDSSLRGVICRYGRFSEANFQDADLSNADFSYTDFSNACLQFADLSNASLQYAELPDVDLRVASLYTSDLFRSKISNSNLKSVDLSDAYLVDADLSKANLERADLLQANLLGADLSEAELRRAELTETNLEGADLSETRLPLADLSAAELSGATLSKADLRRADLSEASLFDADLVGANLSNATAENTNFRYANFADSEPDHRPANLENVVFRSADLRDGDLTDARLDQIDLTDARIDAETEFDVETIYEREEDVTSEVRDDGDDAVPPSAWVHRRLERLHEENALSSVARKFHIRKQRARRKHRRHEGEWLGWAWLTLLGVTMGYGEKPERVLGTAGAVVGLWTLLYPIGAWIVPNPGTPEATQRGLDDGTSAAAAAVRYPAYPNSLAELPAYYGAVFDTLADSIYFSTVTFTTLGFGDFSPVGFGRVLATVESALGVTLFAVLVFVLGRRATR